MTTFAHGSGQQWASYRARHRWHLICAQHHAAPWLTPLAKCTQHLQGERKDKHHTARGGRDGRMGGQRDRRTERQMDGQTDGRHNVGTLMCQHFTALYHAASTKFFKRRKNMWHPNVELCHGDFVVQWMRTKFMDSHVSSRVRWHRTGYCAPFALLCPWTVSRWP